MTYDLGRGPEGEKSLIVQDVYPYAEPRAVTYMAPGQPFYGSMETLGGWFVATSPHAPPMLFLLTEAGLPRNPPSAGDDSPFPWLELAASTTLGALLVVAVASALLRRRPEQATT